MADLGGQIRRAVASDYLAASRRWQARSHGRSKGTRIPPNKVRRGSMETGCPGQPCLLAVLQLFAAVFPWWEPKVEKMRSTGGFLIKVGSLIFFVCYFLCGLPPPIRGGILEFDGGPAQKVKQRRIRFIGSWGWSDCCIQLFLSSCHGGSREMMVMQCYSISDDLGVAMLLKEEHTRSLWRPTLETNWWSATLVLIASDISTSMWRPFCRLAAASPFPSTPSGLVPGAVEDGRGCSLKLVDRSRGPNCVSYPLWRVFPIISWVCVVIFFFLRVPSVKCTCFIDI